MVHGLFFIIYCLSFIFILYFLFLSFIIYFYFLSFIFYCLLIIIYYLLFIIYHLSFIVYDLWFMIYNLWFMYPFYHFPSQDMICKFPTLSFVVSAPIQFYEGFEFLLFPSTPPFYYSIILILNPIPTYYNHL
jgi:hypothetical protein